MPSGFHVMGGFCVTYVRRKRYDKRRPSDRREIKVVFDASLYEAFLGCCSRCFLMFRSMCLSFCSVLCVFPLRTFNCVLVYVFWSMRFPSYLVLRAFLYILFYVFFPCPLQHYTRLFLGFALFYNRFYMRQLFFVSLPVGEYEDRKEETRGA